MKSFWQRGLNDAPRRGMLQTIWGPDYRNEFEYPRAIINRLRKKIEDGRWRSRYSTSHLHRRVVKRILCNLTLTRAAPFAAVLASATNEMRANPIRDLRWQRSLVSRGVRLEQRILA